MKTHSMIFLQVLIFACLAKLPSLQAQGTPDIVWEAPTVSGLANSIQGLGWSPLASGDIVFGSTDRWLRARRSDTGALSYSVLQPHRSGSVNETVYSSDGQFIAVHNSNGGLDYRVHRAVDGVFLGLLTVTLDGQGLLQFAPDSQLLGATGGDGTLSRWLLGRFTIILTVGSGYERTNTTFNVSPDETLQAAASQGQITLRRRSDGSVLRVLTGGLPQGVTPLAFTPDSNRIAAWSRDPNQVTIWRISDGTKLMTFAGEKAEGVTALRFTPARTHLVTTGYLPFLDSAGLWQQKGVIRFWRLADGAMRQMYDAHTGLAVTSPVAWSPDATEFAYGTYEGTAVVARFPAALQTEDAGTGGARGETSVSMLPDGGALLRVWGEPGTAYQVEVTTNLIHWQSAGVSTVNANGYGEFLDANAHQSAYRFYRTRKAE
jgi:WD40 repeat protein